MNLLQEDLPRTKRLPSQRKIFRYMVLLLQEDLAKRFSARPSDARSQDGLPGVNGGRYTFSLVAPYPLSLVGSLSIRESQRQFK